jgi:class 3 adenylate cyclase/tetratricopeptide (TPR) repeat protein
VSATETVTLLFTDVVGSTELLGRLGSERAESLRREHFGVLREQVRRHDGREVKNLGDGIMAVFGSASSALASAVAIQQQLDLRNRGETHETGVWVRIAVSTGDVDVDGDDYFGVPVVEAARLCAVAGAGEIYLTDLVRALVRDRGGHTFEPLGELKLKGLEQAVAAFALRWQPRPGAAQPSLPAPVAARPPALVGRTRELASLEAEFKASAAGSRRLALVNGEPGIGKTTLAMAVARAAHDSGATVLFGGCREDFAMPYQPWTEALTFCAEEASVELLERVRPDAHLLGRLAPAFSDGRRGEAISEPDQYLLYGAVDRWLSALEVDAPVVIVLDDLQWADRASILLMRHLLVRPDRGRTLFIGTYRDAEINAGDPLADLLAASHREQGIDRVVLAGLSADDLVELMEVLAGHDLPDEGIELAHLLREETNGNPFFVGEMLQHLAETGVIERGSDGRWFATADLASLGFPASIREVVGQRVARLDDRTGQLLTYGAVVGREFDLEVVAHVADTPLDDLIDAVDPAIRASIVTEVGPGRFAFVHALVQHTLYGGVSETRRARLHRRVAEALEDILDIDPGERVGELATHWARAVSPDHADKAIEYARLAGERALQQLAPDDALFWFGRAIELSKDRAEDRRRLAPLLVGLGDAQRQTGMPEYRDTLLAAADLALEVGDTELLVRAALANNRGWHSRTGSADTERIRVLEEALALTRDAPAVYPRLLALLAVELTSAGDSVAARRLALADEAVATARASCDLATLARVLDAATFATWVPERLALRVSWSEEALALAVKLGDPVLEYWSTSRRRSTALEEQDRATDDALRPRQRELAELLGQASVHWHTTCNDAGRAFLDGDLSEAERLAEQALDLGFKSGQPDAISYYGAQLVGIRLAQDRLVEMEDLVRQQMEANPGIPAFRYVCARVCADTGRGEEALRLLADDIAQAFETVPHDAMWLVNLVGLASTVSATGDVAAARSLHAMLLPWANRFPQIDILSRAPVAHSLGLLAVVLGNDQEAEEYFRIAIAVGQRVRAPIFVAMAEVDWADLLRSRGDGARADTLLARAISGGGNCGFVNRRVREVRALGT